MPAMFWGVTFYPLNADESRTVTTQTLSILRVLALGSPRGHVTLDIQEFNFTSFWRYANYDHSLSCKKYSGFCLPQLISSILWKKWMVIGFCKHSVGLYLSRVILCVWRSYFHAICASLCMNDFTLRRARLPLRWLTVQPTRSTQPCIPAVSLNRVPASAGVKAGMSITSNRWKVTLCDPAWRASSRSGVATLLFCTSR